MTAQDIANDVSIDMRRLLDATADGNTILGWIDRVHKDVLHSSVWSGANIVMTTITTFVGQASYSLPTNVRRIRSVYHRSVSEMLQPIEGLTAPAPAMEKVAPAVGAPPAPDARQESWQTWGPFPLYYQRVGSSLILYPEPRIGGTTIEVTYEQYVVTLSALTSPLTVPDDARDVMTAGVNMLAALYLKRNDEVQYWSGIYQRLINGATTR